MAPSPFFDLAGMTDDVRRIEEALIESVGTPDPYLNEIASHLIVAGGKRLRPALAAVVGRGFPACIGLATPSSP